MLTSYSQSSVSCPQSPVLSPQSPVLFIEHLVLHRQNNPADDVEPEPQRAKQQHQHKEDAPHVGIHIEVVAQAAADARDFVISFASH